MAKKVIESAVDTYWVDSKDELNANFTELYAAPGAATTATVGELNTLDGVLYSFTTATVPATGTCALTIQLGDASPAAIAGVRAGIGYISDSVGGIGTAITSVAQLTKGEIKTLVTGSVFLWTCNSSGQLDMTLTGAAGSYYVSVVLPNGKYFRSEACVIN